MILYQVSYQAAIKYLLFDLGTPICNAEAVDNVDWPEASENSSAMMLCPGNATGMSLANGDHKPAIFFPSEDSIFTVVIITSTLYISNH